MSELPASQGAIVILRGDRVVVERHSGAADAGAGVACSPRTRYQIASISKQMTAAAVLLLARRGALALDDSIDRWVGGCPDSWRGITLHHLLTHTSGLGHWPEHPMIDLIRWRDPAELLADFRAVPPLFAPGQGWHYSSPGYVLLAHVVQRAADEPYRDFLNRRVFAPLGMERSFAGNPDGRDDVAVGYAGGRPVPSYELDSVGMGAGDVWSTAGDMVAWIDGLRAGRLLEASDVELMFTAHAAARGGPEQRAYGYGWFVGELAGEECLHHSGHNDGFKAFAAWLPASDRRVVVLANRDEVDPVLLGAILAES